MYDCIHCNIAQYDLPTFLKCKKKNRKIPFIIIEYNQIFLLNSNTLRITKQKL